MQLFQTGILISAPGLDTITVFLIHIAARVSPKTILRFPLRAALQMMLEKIGAPAQ